MTRPAPFAARRALAWIACACAMAQAATASVPEAPPAILQDLRSFREFGSVLYIAAHPDDENTQLITYLARGRSYRTAYLSLTRGDGGQNVLGPEFGDLLGVIRTQELLAARNVDGGRQFFSRARDFGYSKDYRDTLSKWDRQEVLSDIVRVIRTFRPDVIITRFPPEPSGTHGHHTASSALAVEAFKLCGDPTAFPEQLATLATWQPRRILWNGYGSYPGAPAAPTDTSAVKINIDGTDLVTGAPFAVLAAKSRSMHRTQGFANFSVAAGGNGPRIESFKLLDGEPAQNDIMDGVDDTWGRIPGGAEIGRLAGAVIDHFDPANPASSVPALLGIEARLGALGADPIVEEKHRQLDRILQSCLGLSVETTVPSHEVVPGETLQMTTTATLLASIPVSWEAPGPHSPADTLSPGVPVVRQEARVLPANTPLSQPYWLREAGTPGMFRVDDAALIGLPEAPPPIRARNVFMLGDQAIVVEDEVFQVTDDPQKGEIRRRVDVIPPVSLGFSSTVALFAPGSSHKVEVDILSSRAGASGTLGLDTPGGWTASPKAQPFHLAAAGDSARFTFTVGAPAASTTGAIAAHATIDGVSYGNQRIEINYPHIPPQLLQPPARLKVASLDLAIRGQTVGYIPGAGDGTVQALQLMGYRVSTLSGADITAENLARFDAVVIGVRAFNTRKDLPAQLPALFAYVAGGGTVVDQYNTPGGLEKAQLAPYDLRLNRDLPHYRVTNERAPVDLLIPDHPAFTTPNRIVPADFDGWVQERGLDFASEWDTAHFDALIACSDAGEAPLSGGLLVAHYGKGIFVYTGLSFFRQLPAGVPGAYRLFANLVSLGR